MSAVQYLNLMECMNDLGEREKEMMHKKQSDKKARVPSCLKVRKRNIGKSTPRDQAVKSGGRKLVSSGLQD